MIYTLRHHPIRLAACLLGLASLACNLPLRDDPPTSPSPPTPASTTQVDITPTTSPDDPPDPTAAATLDTAATPTLSLPEGWLPENSPALRLAFHRPPDWQIIPFDATRLEVREQEGFAWIEIGVLDESTDDSWSLSYRPGLSADEIMTTLVAAARQDGTYDDPHHVIMPDGRTAWATQGFNDLLNANVFIGVIGYPDRALIVLGHDSGVEGDWESTLLPLYEALFATIQPG